MVQIHKDACQVKVESHILEVKMESVENASVTSSATTRMTKALSLAVDELTNRL
jgi:hypothetical protein